ncbi:MAG: tetratricopeptide repeat protein [Burkholderiaceae bacterium]|nr:tetratricopeptide repeat protein [Rhodoferax sp.]MCP5285242.1 tetratricopeptide repeat protein [Burkholderiaceae bacterium]
MAAKLDLTTPPTPLQYFAALVAHDDGLPLLEAAAAIAQHAQPTLDTQAVLAEVDQLGDVLRRRIPADAGALQRLQLLNRYFFKELGFSGNLNHYEDPANSDLLQVLARRRGIPISLAVLYMELAAHAGLSADGVSFPGHFLVKLHLPQGEVVMDPFSGRSLSRDELEERLQPWRSRMALSADDEPPLGLFLQAATPRDILARMLRNLKAIHQGARDLPQLLSVQERLVALLPDDLLERRDRALIDGQLGRLDRACTDLAAYLQAHPDAEDAPALRDQLARWRQAPPATLH